MDEKSMPTTEERERWREEAEIAANLRRDSLSSCCFNVGTPACQCDPGWEHRRILALLDALNAAERQWHRYIVDAERAQARAEQAERERDEVRDTLRELQEAYRTAIGVPESHHQRERMERIASAYEQAEVTLARVRALADEASWTKETVNGSERVVLADDLRAALDGGEDR